MPEPHFAVRARVLEEMYTYEPGWRAMSVLCGMFAGPATGLLEYATLGVDGSSFSAPACVPAGATVLGVCLVVLYRNGVRTTDQ